MVHNHVEGKVTALPRVGCNTTAEDSMPPSHTGCFIGTAGGNERADIVLTFRAGIDGDKLKLDRRRWTTVVITSSQSNVAKGSGQHSKGKNKGDRSRAHSYFSVSKGLYKNHSSQLANWQFSEARFHLRYRFRGVQSAAFVSNETVI